MPSEDEVEEVDSTDSQNEDNYEENEDQEISEEDDETLSDDSDYAYSKSKKKNTKRKRRSSYASKKNSKKKKSTSSTRKSTSTRKKSTEKPFDVGLFSFLYFFSRNTDYFGIELASSLSEQFPDKFWKTFNWQNTVNTINSKHILKSLAVKIEHHTIQSRVHCNFNSVSLSNDCTMLAVATDLGVIQIYKIEDIETTNTLPLIQELKRDLVIPNSSEQSSVDRDLEFLNNNSTLEDFYFAKFTPNDRYIVAGGKCKKRYQWESNENDNAITNCPIVIFDVLSGKIISELHAHTEEVLCLKMVYFKGNFYYLSASYDGSIRRWKMKHDFITLEEMINLDNITATSICIAMIPNCGNKYFLAGCDYFIKLIDFETGDLLQQFDSSFSYLCDGIKFLPKANDEEPNVHYFVTRGMENENSEDGKTPNKVIVNRLVLPIEYGVQCKVETIHTLTDETYFANHWLMRLAVLPHYVLAPNGDGSVIVWNVRTGVKSAVIAFAPQKEEEEENPRKSFIKDIAVHPWKNLLFMVGNDSQLRVMQK